MQMTKLLATLQDALFDWLERKLYTPHSFLGSGHWWGYRNFEVADASRNIVIGGEELHNNHHTYPTSAKLSSAVAQSQTLAELVAMREQLRQLWTRGPRVRCRERLKARLGPMVEDEQCASGYLKKSPPIEN